MSTIDHQPQRRSTRAAGRRRAESARGRPRFRAACLRWGAVGFLALGGCGRTQATASREPGAAVLGELTRAYVSHLRTHAFLPPASESELKKALAGAGAEPLKRAGVRSVDEFFVSPRDAQPFVIRYGKDARTLLDRGIVAYEQTGVGGSRLVGYALGYVRETDQQTFDQLLGDASP
jgi:hypothetical protein